MSKPEILNILVDEQYESTSASLAPTVFWQYYDVDEDDQSSYYLKIGSISRGSDIVDTGWVMSSDSQYIVPSSGYSSLIKNGLKYYITLTVQNSSETSIQKETFFITTGDYWANNVDNSTGWTIEFYYRFNGEVSSADFSETNPHHYIEIKDGTYAMSVEMYADRVRTRTSEVSTYLIDNTKLNLFRITGRDDDVSLYINGYLALEVIGKNSIATTTKDLKFSGTQSSLPVASLWSSIFLNLDGMIDVDELPDSLVVSSVLLHGDEIVDIAQDTYSRDQVYVAANPEDVTESGRIFKVHKNFSKHNYSAEAILQTGTKKVVVDKDSDKWVSTSDSIYKISGEKDKGIGYDVSLSDESNLVGFQRVENCSGVCASFNKILRIDTESESGDTFWYYKTVENNNSVWFGGVDNDTGWMVESTVRIVDNNSSSSSAGLIINDGAHEETIYLFKDKILLKNANTSAYQDLSTDKKSIRVVGKGGDIFVYVKNGSYWSKVIDGTGRFVGAGQIYSDSGKPSVTTSSSYGEYVVWHSKKGSQRWQIFLNSGGNNDWAHERQLTFDTADNFNPDVVVDDSGTVHVVYQTNKFGSWEIVYLKYNGYQAVERTRITNAVGNSTDPRICLLDNGDIAVAWLDDREGSTEVYGALYSQEDDAWFSSAFDYNDEKISDAGGTYVAKNVKISTNGESCAICWNDNRNSLESVFISTTGEVDNDGHWWGDEVQVSPSITPAFSPNIALEDSGKVNIVWVDSRLGADKIYYNSYQGSLGAETVVSSGSSDAENPSITLVDGEKSILWVSIDSEMKIYHRRTVSGSFSSFVDIFTNSDVNILDAKISNIGSGNENRVVFRASDSTEYTSIYGYKFTIPDADSDLSADISSSSTKISNLDNTKSISFGDIAQTSTNVSEWDNLRYSVTSDLHPLVINEWSFSDIIDFQVDDEKNLYVIDANGLAIYDSVIGSALSSSESSASASSSAPANLVQIFISDSNRLFVHDGSKIFYHLPITSKDIDQDMEWFEIDTSNISGTIKFVGRDPIGGLLWIGTDSYAISVPTSSVFYNNTIPSSSMTIYASGKSVNSISFGNEYIWISVVGGVYKVNRYNNSSSIIDINDGLIDNDVMKTVIDDDGQWIFGSNGLIRISGTTITIYREKISTDLISDIYPENGKGVWIAGDSGLEFLSNDGLTNYSIDKADGVGVISADNAYKNYIIKTSDSLDRKYHHLVKVNGVFRDPDTFFLDSTNKVILFSSRLSSSSSVELIYYNLVEKVVDFSDSTILIEVPSSSPKRLTSLENGDYVNQLVVSMVIDGDSYVYKLLFGSSFYGVSYPFGTIIYDKTPPLGTIDIVDQISSSQVILSISATDAVSGVNEMIVSRYPNFTSDGEVTLSPIPYNDRVTFDLGENIGTGITIHEFTTSVGKTLHTFTRNYNNSTVSELFAGASSPAKILKFNVSSRSWENVENLNADVILSMETHLGKMYVGTGNSGKIFFTENGIDYSLLTELTEPYVYSMLSASDNKLYIGSGSSGKVYTYDGTNVSLLFDTQETSVLDMVEFSGNVYMATGNNGRIYRYNLSSGSLEIIFDDSDAQILSISTGKDFNSNSETIYAGTFSNGKVLRYVSSRGLFVKSFESVLTACRSIKTFWNSEGSEVTNVYACIDNRMLKLENTSWSAIYIDSNLENIQDMELFEGELFIITDGGIKTIATSLDKYVYVKFIDFAGNETVLYASDGTLKPRTETERLFDILTAEEQSGFSLQNRILVVDDSGVVTKTFNGTRPFFSADKIDEEIAVYDSEVFNGTNNLVAWNTISYSAVIPTNTSIEISIRSAATEDGIEDEIWSDPVESGRDISGISGKYIQFRVKLKSQSRGITPVLNNVTITSKSTFAVHFFTTNFSLSSNLKSGLFTANTVTPVGTELVFGVTSDSSSNWSDYQIIEPNRLFVVEDSKRGPNLKIGVKFLSTTEEIPELHELGLIFCTEGGELIKLNL